jgi:hypothetical protein
VHGCEDSSGRGFNSGVRGEERRGSCDSCSSVRAPGTRLVIFLLYFLFSYYYYQLPHVLQVQVLDPKLDLFISIDYLFLSVLVIDKSPIQIQKKSKTFSS